MSDKIAELREMEKAATPAPWYRGRPLQKAPRQAEHTVAVIGSDPVIGGGGPLATEQADMDFVVAMRNALPALLDVVEAARTVAEGCPCLAERFIDGYHQSCGLCVPCRLHAALAALDGAKP